MICGVVIGETTGHVADEVVLERALSGGLVAMAGSLAIGHSFQFNAWGASPYEV